MALIHRFLFLFPAVILAGVASASASPFLSDNVFPASTGTTGRSLLQTKMDCPMNFESQDYTIIRSKCKAPQYPPTECCDALKEFACPFAVYINNQSTNCADTVLSYINFQGSHPAALFADECLKGKEWVSCEGVPRIHPAMRSCGRRSREFATSFDRSLVWTRSSVVPLSDTLQFYKYRVL